MTAGQIATYLAIVKGIGPAVGDTNSAEQAKVELNLMSGADGFALESWTPSYPANKGGGVFADSPVSDGRLMLAAAKQQVVETMTLTVGSQHVATRFALLSQLMRMAEDAEKQWTTTYQIEPVYLTWHAPGAPVPQHALITSIQIAQRGEIFETLNAWTLTITIEREPAWRMLVPPGGNPKLWTKYAAGLYPGQDFDYDDLDLNIGSDHFVSATIYNKHEWAAAGPLTTTLSVNYIDIGAEAVPGDAPALVLLHITGQTAQIQFARSTRSLQRANVLNAGDADVSSLIAKTIDTCGVYSNFSAANKYIGTYTIGASATTAAILRWDLSANIYRGKYAVFLRCKQTTGSAGDVQVRARLYDPNSSLGTAFDMQNTLAYNAMPIITTASGCSYRFDTLYLGTIDIPLDYARAAMDVEGRGIDATPGPIYLYIDGKNGVASTRALQFLDVFLMPVDESYGIVQGLWSQIIVDNTGYVAHGGIEPRTMGSTTAAGELRGQALTLEPGRGNRVYFLRRNYFNLGGGFFWESDTSSIDVRLNIVPRCYGIASL